MPCPFINKNTFFQKYLPRKRRTNSVSQATPATAACVYWYIHMHARQKQTTPPTSLLSLANSSPAKLLPHTYSVPGEPGPLPISRCKWSRAPLCPPPPPLEHGTQKNTIQPLSSRQPACKITHHKIPQHFPKHSEKNQTLVRPTAEISRSNISTWHARRLALVSKSPTAATTVVLIYLSK